MAYPGDPNFELDQEIARRRGFVFQGGFGARSPISSFVILVLLGVLTGAGIFYQEEIIREATKYWAKITNQRPDDYRKAPIEDLAPEEREHVRVMATAQSTFNVVTAGAFILSMLFIISHITLSNDWESAMAPVRDFSGPFLKDATTKPGPGLFFLACLVLAISGYALWNILTIAGFYELPWYVRLWGGRNSRYFVPQQLLLVLLASAAVVVVAVTNWEPTVKGWATQFKEERDSTSTIGWLAFAVMAVYVIYEFFGTVLIGWLQQNELMRSITPYVWPAFLTLSIAALAIKLTAKGEFAAGALALVVVGGGGALMTFASGAVRKSQSAIEAAKDSLDYYVFVFFCFLAFGTALWLAQVYSESGPEKFIDTVGGELQARAKQVGGWGASALDKAQGTYNGARSQGASFDLFAALLGGFLFFAVQLFWTTSFVLGDALITGVGMIIGVLVYTTLTGMQDHLRKVIYAGFTVTGIAWFMTLQSGAFRRLEDTLL